MSAKAGLSVKTFFLGDSSPSYSISWDLVGMPSLFYKDDVLDEASIAGADIIFSKWWRFDSPPLVRFNWKDPDSQRFGESEWTASICSALLTFYDIFKPKWIGNPVPNLGRNTRLFLLQKAAAMGFSVPDSVIDTKVNGLDPTGSWVAKPISEDERVAEGRYFFTSQIGREMLPTISGRRSECPSFIQRGIQCRSEIRAYFINGEILSFELKGPESGWEDIRSILDEVSVSPTRLEEDCRQRISDLMQEIKMSYCALDFLVDHWGDCHLVDITPDASWGGYEKTSVLAVTQGMLKEICAAK